MNVQVFSETRCALGEGPAWDPDTESLLWVDIRSKKVLTKPFGCGIERVWDLLLRPSAAIRTHSGDVLVPAEREVLRLNRDSGDFYTVWELENEPEHNRCNDAKCDPAGNLWIGTVDSEERVSTGRLWRIDAAGNGTVLLTGIGVSNTLAWDERRSRFYFADSMVGDIYAFEYDAARGILRDGRVFFRRDLAPGVPDGSAIDTQGYLWNARWNGSCIVRISPEGMLDRVIDLPARYPTSCAFGGPDLKTLFVTSAAVDPGTRRDADHLDGAVFRIDLDVAGSSVPSYGGAMTPAATSATA